MLVSLPNPLLVNKATSHSTHHQPNLWTFFPKHSQRRQFASHRTACNNNNQLQTQDCQNPCLFCHLPQCLGKEMRRSTPSLSFCSFPRGSLSELHSVWWCSFLGGSCLCENTQLADDILHTQGLRFHTRLTIAEECTLWE